MRLRERIRSPRPLSELPRQVATALLVACVVIAGCGGSEDSEGDSAGEGAIPRECVDGLDNDRDGAVDCDDDGCVGNPDCRAGLTDTGGSDTGAVDAGDGDATAADSDADGDDDAVQDDVTEDDGAGSDDAGEDDVTGDDAASDADDLDGPADDADDVDVDVEDGSGDDAGETDVGTEGGPVRDCTTTIAFDGPGIGAGWHVAGEWNGFSCTDDALEDPDRDGRFSVELELPPGEHGYKFARPTGGDPACEFESELPVDIYTKWVGGVENRAVIVGDCERPTLETLSATGGVDGVEADVQFWRAADGAALDLERLDVTVGGEPVETSFDAESGVISIDVDELSPGKHSVRVSAVDVDGRATEESPLFIPLWVEDVRFDWQDGPLYFVFTDRFRNSDFDADDPVGRPIEGVPEISNYQGGDFFGVTQALREGYFDELGVRSIWLSPVYDNPNSAHIATDRVHQFTGFHGYWPISGRGIEEKFGDVGGEASERLHELIEEAHRRGIRVIFDMVLNHVHEDHEYVEEHPSWFTAEPCNCTTDPGPCNWDTNPLFCWFIEYLPDLDYRNHEIVRQLSSDLEWFVTEYDVDGFRIDAAKHMNHVIMRRVRKRMEERFVDGGGAEIYLVGETFTGADGHGSIMRYVGDHELHGQFDFPLMWPIRDAFGGGGSYRALDERVAIGRDVYGDAYRWMSPFLGNHDIPRMANVIQGAAGVDPWAGVPDPMASGGEEVTQWDTINRMSHGFLFVLTQPGVPLIYYGDEIGLFGGADPDNRRLMTFEPFLSANQRTLLDRIQAIGTARATHRALQRGAMRTLWVDDTLYVYARHTPEGDVAIVAMNKGGARVQGVAIPEALGLSEGQVLADLLSDSRSIEIVGANATFRLAPWEYAIYATER